METIKLVNTVEIKVDTTDKTAPISSETNSERTDIKEHRTNDSDDEIETSDDDYIN